MKTIFISFLAALASPLALGACGSGPPDPASGKRVVAVVAGENFWGDLAAQIGGKHADVTSIITDSALDPHIYSSDARGAARIAGANLVIVNGAGYDDFMIRLLKATVSDRRRVLDVAKFLGVGSDSDPHLWYDIGRIALVARGIQRDLSIEDPRDSRYFAARVERFISSLRPILGVIAQIAAKHRGAPVAYTERVPGYLLNAAGLNVITPAGFARAIEAGNEPSPADAQTLSSLISHRRVRVLVYNSQATSAITRRLRDVARRAGVPVVGVTETLPPSEPSYQAWQLHQVRALQAALRD